MGAFCQFAVEEVLRDAARFHMPDVAEPAQTPLTKQGEHAVCAGSLQNFRVGDFLPPGMCRIRRKHLRWKLLSFFSCLA